MQAELRALIERSVDALDIEISTIKSEDPVNTISVYNGKFIEKIDNFFVYDFELDEVIEFSDKIYFEVNTNEKTFRGVLLNSNGLSIKIAVEKDELKGDLTQLILLFDPIYHQTSLKSSLNRILDRNKISNEDLLSKLFGIHSIKPVKDTITQIVSSVILDEYQIEAIQHSLGTDVSFIWGMPGTGKKVTLAHLFEHLSKTNESILFLANSDEVIDDTFSEYLSLFSKSNPNITNGGIYRAGIILNDDLRKSVNKESVINAKSAPRIEAVDKKKIKLNQIFEAIKNIQQRVSDSEELNHQIENHKVFQDKFNSIKLRNEKFHAELKKIDAKIEELTDQIEKETKNLKDAESANSVSRVLRRLQSAEKIKEALKELNSQKDALQKSKILKDELSNQYLLELESAKNDADHIAQSVKNLNLKYKNEPLEEEHIIKSKLNELNGQLKHCRYDISKFENEIKQIEQVAISEAEIIGANLNDFYLSDDLQSKSYDVIIIDEASAAILPKIIFAAAFAKKKIIVAGDFLLQKPKVFAAQNEHVKTWLKRNIFEVLEIYEEPANKVVLDFRVAALRRQKKYSEAITEILNNCFYEKRLTNFISADNFLPEEKPVSLIDTSEIDPFNFVDKDQNRFNFHNAVISLNAAKKYYENPNVEKICIFALHKAQGNLIAKLIYDYNLTEKISVEFPENCSTQLYDVVILDMVEGMHPQSSTLSKRLTSDAYKHYFNLAVSKTYKKFIVIVNRKHLLQNVGVLNDSVIKLLSTITKSTSENFEVLEADSFLKKSILNEDENSAVILAESLLYFDEENYKKSFFAEVQNEINNIIIYTPQISLDEINKNYLELFRNLKEWNINIGIITAPQTEQKINISGIVEVLSNLGVKFIFSENLIENLIILNNKIIYFGNVNLLFPQPDNKNMFRINLKKTGEELLGHYNSNLFSESFKIAKITKEISEDLPF